MTTLATAGSERGYAVALSGQVARSSAVPVKNASEAEVVRRAQQGDQEAFAEIVQRNQNMVYSVAYRMVRRRIDAEDVAQQVFTKVFFAIKKFNMRSSLSTWIYRIALNETYDYLRKLRTRKVLYFGDLPETENEPVRDAERTSDVLGRHPERTARRDYLLKLLAHVSEQERMLLFQKEVEGLTINELSELTGINGNTIKVKLFRARKKLVKAARALESRETE